MLIGIDANEANLTSYRVGINQYAFNLLHALYKTSSIHNFVIYLKNIPLDDLPKERKNWQYRVIPFPKLWTQTRLPFDLFVHTPRPDVLFSMTHYAPRWSPVPVVISIMDLGFLRSPEQFTPKDLNQLKSWTKYSAHQAKKIITISEFSKKDILNYYHRNSEDIVVTYPSYDEKLFKPTHNPKVLTKYGIDKPYFLFLGSLKPSKNIEALIRAFYNLGSNCHLVIAGKKAWMYDKIFALVKKLNLEDKVIFTGFIEESEVPVLVSHAEAFVMPSLFEGFGIPALEAMACGTPVIVSKIASLPEVTGNAGIYIDPHLIDSITAGLRVATGPRREEFVKLGLARVKSFSWTKCAQQTIACLETATENH